GDTENFIETYDTANVGTNKTLSPSGLVNDGNSGANYAVTFVNDNTGVISIKNINVTANTGTKIYGDLEPVLAYAWDALSGSDTFSGSLERAAGENVNTYAINQGTLSAGSNYAINFTGADFTITAKPITVTADAKSKTYAGSDPALTYQITSGSLIGSDTLSGSLSRATGENYGVYLINQNTLIASSNYNLIYIPANFTINKATLNVTADDKSIIYNDSDPAFTVTYSGFVNGEDVTVLTSLSSASVSGAHTNSGTYAIIPFGGTADNYSFSYHNGTLTVNKKHITGSFTANNKIYDGNNSAIVATRTLIGVIGLDDVTLSDGIATFSNANVADGKTVTLSGPTLSGFTANNYALDSIATTTANIMKANATIIVTPYSLTYDGFSHTATYSVLGVLGETLSGLVVSGTTHTNASAYINDPWTFTDITGNYNNASGTVNDAIAPKAITITALAQTKIYGATDPVLSYNYGALSSGDNDSVFSGSLARASGENVGAYAINQGTLVSNSNYTLIYTGANLVITAKPITVTAVANTKTTDSNTSASAIPTITSGVLVG
ncbi:MAG: MBG domain-containing protein, partial [Patescibacteria group bacterium]